MHQAFSRFTRLPVSLREGGASWCRPGRTPVGDGEVCCRTVRGFRHVSCRTFLQVTRLFSSCERQDPVADHEAVLGDRSAQILKNTFSGIINIVIKEMQHNKDFKRYVFSILCAMCVILLKEHWITIIGVLIFLFSFVLAINYKLKFLNAKTLVYIGGISYPLYIIHQNLGYQLMLCMTKMLNKFSNIYILVTIIMAILIATLLQYMSEKFANLLKNKSIGKQNF